MSNPHLHRICLLLAASLVAAPTVSAQLVGPSAPANLAAKPTAPGEITLTWDAATSATGVAGYRVYLVADDGALVHLVDVPPDQLSFAHVGIAPGTTVTYAVSAFDILGEGPASAPASATTWSVPSAPADVAAVSGPGPVGEATLTWAAPQNDGGTALIGYLVYRDGALVGSVEASMTMWTDTGLSPLRAYAYTVSAVNLVGEGAASDAACGMASPWAAELGCMTVL